MPKVSVVIPTHNRPELLKRAVDSVLAQTHKDLEIIIVDDGDVSVEDVASSFHDPRIKYIKHETPHGGGSVTRNTGIKGASGKFVAFLDDDDEWLPSKLEKQVEILEKNQEIGLTFCKIEAIGSDGRSLYVSKIPREGIQQPYEDLLKKAFIWTSSVLIRREFFDKGVVFDATLPKNQEWDLTLRLAKITKFYAINEALVKLHIHENQMGSSNNIPKRIQGYKLFIKKHQSDYLNHKSFLAQRYYEIGILYKEDGKIFDAAFFFMKANFISPRRLFIRSFLSLIKDIYYKLRHNRLVRVLSWPLRKAYRSSYFSNLRNRRNAFRSAEKMLSSMGTDSEKTRALLKEVKGKSFFKREFSFGHAGDFEVIMLYTLSRILKPATVVETGVASGRSSWAILEALEDNRYGRLYSIDLPQFFGGKEPEKFVTEEGRSEFRGFVPMGQKPGWLVPGELRNRWELLLGKSEDNLPLLLKKLGSIDIFYHDSDHSYKNMAFEFKEVWPVIKKEGFLLSDDVKWNKSFDDFINTIRPRFYAKAEGFGLILK